MSQKQLKPTLTGQRIRARKRDDKHRKLDPETFRDEILIGLIEAEGKFPEMLTFLETAGHRLEYNRYGETLFEILIAGNLIAPGGQVEEEDRFEGCVFDCTDESQILSFTDIMEKLMRRYKYLLKIFQNHMAHMVKYINIFPEKHVNNFAVFLGLEFVSSQCLNTKCLESLFVDHLTRDDIALNFVTKIFTAWLKNTDFDTFSTILKKSGLSENLINFFPEAKRKPEIFEEHFTNAGLIELVKFQKQKVLMQVKADLRGKLAEMLESGEPFEKISEVVFATSKEAKIPESQLNAMVWPCVMECSEWSKKGDMLEKQVVQHMATHAQLLKEFTKTGRAQLNTLNVIQKYCYENMIFLKYLRNIVLALYNNDVIEEVSILKWYKDSHISKGWSVFEEQMLVVINWLETAECESETE